jgi:endo-1,4-beta-D-glucanase Y
MFYILKRVAKAISNHSVLVLLLFVVTAMYGLLITVNPTEASNSGAFFTNNYRNLFREWGRSDSEVQSRVNAAFNSLFYGDNNHRVYYPVGSNMAYIADNNTFVMSEGMSYGMMIAVQMNKKAEFDRLWTWAKTYMQHQSGLRAGYFAWKLNTSGQRLDENPASDGETYFATALFFAAGRWGNGSGIYNYQAEANAILDAMLHKESSNGGVVQGVTNMFHSTYKQVVFTPIGNAATFTDPSYHTPAFYELWGRWADSDNQFWFEAAGASRWLFQRAANSTTGLMPDYSEFNGAAHTGSPHENFSYDAWRAISNIGVDYAWFGADSWQVTQSNRLLNFFYSKGITTYNDEYTLSGRSLSPYHSPGLVAMNAVGALAANTGNRWAFVQDFWNTPIPSGQYRYYNGLLYMLGLLHVSGNFRIYGPTGGGGGPAQPPPSTDNAVPSINQFKTLPLTLTWGRVTWAWGYEIQIGRDAALTNPTYRNNALSGQTLSYTQSSIDNGQWYWRVRAKRQDGTWGPWSAVDTFMVSVG